MYSREVPLSKVPQVVENGYLESIFAQQKKLLDYYANIEKLPPYPINIDTKDSQAVIKDMTDRVIEELAEAYEYQLEIAHISEQNGYFAGCYAPVDYAGYVKNKKRAINCIHDFNEELADAMHFMVELLIYANIGPEDLKDFAIKHHPNYKLGQDLNTRPVLDTIMLLGKDLVNYKEMNKVPIVSLQHLLNDEDPTLRANVLTYYSPSGWTTSTELCNKYSLPLWDIVYSLKMSTNCLKNRAWKVDERVVDVDKYQSLLAESFVKMMGYYYILGLRPYNLHTIYSLKNAVNQFRIESGY